MRRFLLTVAALLAILAPSTVAADGTSTETFSAGGLTTVQLSVENGNLVVTTGDASTVTVTNASTDGFVAAAIQQNGSMLSGYIANPDGDVTLQVPAGLALNVQTTNGSITISGSQGDLTLTADNGSVTVQGSGAQPLNIRASNGTVQVSGESGGGVIGDSNGDVTVTLPSGDGAQLNLAAPNGQLQVSGTTQSQNPLTTTVGSGGPLWTIQTSNGNVAVQ